MIAFQVTLTAKDTNYHLIALARAIESTYVDHGRQITVEADEANTDTVLLGGPDLATDRFGRRLFHGTGQTFGAGGGLVHLRGKYARSGKALQKLNLTVER